MSDEKKSALQPEKNRLVKGTVLRSHLGEVVTVKDVQDNKITLGGDLWKGGSYTVEELEALGFVVEY